ncbi:MAG TPA: MFS transporter [candidate division Zixibacteria bacterium]|nr:MFS transporter [candidate division Zixibacteria bacterium]
MSLASSALSLVRSLRVLGAERAWLLGVLTAGHFVIHWFQQSLPVILPTLKADLGLSHVEVGALSSAQQMVAGLGQLPLGIAADSLVRHRAAILALSLASMGTAYFLLGAGWFFAALVGSGLVGLGTALWHPAAAGVLSNRFPERRGTALSIHGTGATLSDTITPFCVGFLLASFSWRGLTQAQLVPGLLFGFLLWRALTTALGDGGPAPASASGQLRDVARLLRDAAFLGVSAATGLLQMGRLVVLTFFPIYLQEHLGYTSVGVGGFVALLHVMGIVSQPVLGLLSDRFGRKAVLVPSCLALGLFFALLAAAPAGAALALVVLVTGVFFYTIFNIMNAAVMDVAGSNIQSSTYGLTFLITQLAVIPTPMLTGYLIGAWGIRSAFVLAGIFLLVGAAVIAPLKLYGGTRAQQPASARK